MLWSSQLYKNRKPQSWVKTRIIYLIIVLVRQTTSGDAEIVLLDHGLYESIGTTQRIALAKMYKAIILKDEEAMKENALELNVSGEWVTVSQS